MNPYRNFMQKAAMGVLRRAWLSQHAMTPEQALKFSDVVERLGNWKLRKAGISGRPRTTVSLSQAPGLLGAGDFKHLDMRIDHFPEQKQLFGLLPSRHPFGGFGTHTVDVLGRDGVAGKVGVYSIDKEFQGRGLGSGMARVSDDIMEQLGARQIKTTVVNPKHVEGYRTRLGYKPVQREVLHMMGMPDTETVRMVKDVADTPAVARDRAIAQLMDRHKAKSIGELMDRNVIRR